MSSDRGPLYDVCAWASALLPLSFSLSRLDGAERWVQDVAVVRALDLVQLGGEGVLSSALGAALSQVPIGTSLLRLSVLSALMVAVGGYAVFRFGYSLLRDQVGPQARSLLALCGAVAAAAGGAWQAASVVVGGPALAAALGLGWLLHLQLPGSTRVWLARAALLSMLLLESRVLGAASLLPLALRLLLRAELPTLRQLGFALLLLVAVLVVGLLPTLLESRVSGFRLGLDLALPPDRSAMGQIDLHSELGSYLLGLAVLATVFTFRTPHGRLAMLPAASWVALDWCSSSPALHLAAVGVCAALGCVGLARLARALSGRRTPFARWSPPALALVHLCALLLLLEGAARDAEQRTMTATREWSEQAFERLPAQSMLLVSSPEAVWRLWAARLTSGIRPDVVMVPTSLLARGALASDLLQLEPRLGALLRDVAVQGVPGEYSLAELADARPLRVEVDAAWDRSLLRHLTPDGLWFRFAAHATGRSDRARAQHTSRNAASYVLGAALTPRGRDVHTVQRTLEDLYRQAAVATLLGDREDAAKLVRQLRRLGCSEAALEALSRSLSGSSTEGSVSSLRQLPSPQGP